ncbi:hypothetical protein METBIDRAFT_40706 [Metschnikowia bicuspidata var. bicuspidata NRRL YB-4993]|uniref:Uncharacterized protein n=1 Tax=Metschnikowia bicuspidata var. bicuspidata NRRL YB-4993 TaxID=869754 RepID=A0A1A0HEJ9_9ASCO|nr:hypothetical protein METBIDRAFT_40706 [Metschnikowia bicuspidata var. bicuspidata NRRL YB-4993]OBA22327.1 hypothetical protein METBIDRAFT_40706 [Metschnikowia bicuspidata var. bicuspidata NRRL YB-4993]
MDSYLLESSAPEHVMADDYQLALKIFMNKDIVRSFGMVSKLQPAAFRNLDRGLISEELFLKITTLYLTEVGLLLDPQVVPEASLNIQDRQQLVESLQKHVVVDQMAHLYGALADAPLNLLFHIFLLYYTSRDALQAGTDGSVLQQFSDTYHALEFQGRQEDRFLKRWFDMYVLNVLPDAGDFATAFAIAESNTVFGGALAVAKLKEVQRLKTQQEQARKKAQKELHAREARARAAEQEQERIDARERSLKYRSMQQIRAEQQSQEPPSSAGGPGDAPAAALTLQRIRERLRCYYVLSKNGVKTHSPVLLAVVVLLLICGLLLRRRKINFRQRVKETLRMAFKVTYL